MPRGGQRAGAGRPKKDLQQPEVLVPEVLTPEIIPPGEEETPKKGQSGGKYAAVKPLKNTSPNAVATLIAQVINDQLQPRDMRQLEDTQADRIVSYGVRLLKARSDAIAESKITRMKKQIRELLEEQKMPAEDLGAGGAVIDLSEEAGTDAGAE